MSLSSNAETPHIGEQAANAPPQEFISHTSDELELRVQIASDVIHNPLAPDAQVMAGWKLTDPNHGIPDKINQDVHTFLKFAIGQWDQDTINKTTTGTIVYETDDDALEAFSGKVPKIIKDALKANGKGAFRIDLQGLPNKVYSKTVTLKMANLQGQANLKGQKGETYFHLFIAQKDAKGKSINWGQTLIKEWFTESLVNHKGIEVVTSDVPLPDDDKETYHRTTGTRTVGGVEVSYVKYRKR